MLIHFCVRLSGHLDRDTEIIATRCVHVMLLPVLPLGTFVSRTRGQTWEKAPFSFKSLFAAFAKWWLLPAALLAWAFAHTAADVTVAIGLFTAALASWFWLGRPPRRGLRAAIPFVVISFPVLAFLIVGGAAVAIAAGVGQRHDEDSLPEHTGVYDPRHKVIYAMPPGAYEPVAKAPEPPPEPLSRCEELGLSASAPQSFHCSSVGPFLRLENDVHESVWLTKTPKVASVAENADRLTRKLVRLRGGKVTAQRITNHQCAGMAGIERRGILDGQYALRDCTFTRGNEVFYVAYWSPEDMAEDSEPVLQAIADSVK